MMVFRDGPRTFFEGIASALRCGTSKSAGRTYSRCGGLSQEELFQEESAEQLILSVQLISNQYQIRHMT